MAEKITNKLDWGDAAFSIVGLCLITILIFNLLGAFQQSTTAGTAEYNQTASILTIVLVPFKYAESGGALIGGIFTLLAVVVFGWLCWVVTKLAAFVGGVIAFLMGDVW